MGNPENQRNYELIKKDKSNSYEKHAKGKISPNDFRIALSIYKEDIFLDKDWEAKDIWTKLNKNEMTKTAESRLNQLVETLAYIEHNLWVQTLDAILYGTTAESEVMKWSRVVKKHIPLQNLILFVDDLKANAGQEQEDIAHMLSLNKTDLRENLAAYSSTSTLTKIWNDNDNEFGFWDNELVDNGGEDLIPQEFKLMLKQYTWIDMKNMFGYIRTMVRTNFENNIDTKINELPEVKKLGGDGVANIKTYLKAQFNETHEHNLSYAISALVTQKLSEVIERKNVIEELKTAMVNGGKDTAMSMLMQNDLLWLAVLKPWSSLRSNINTATQTYAQHVAPLYNKNTHGEVALVKGLANSLAKGKLNEANRKIWSSGESFDMFNDVDRATALVQQCALLPAWKTLDMWQIMPTASQEDAENNDPLRQNLLLQQQMQVVDIEPSSSSDVVANVQALTQNLKNQGIDTKLIKKVTVDMATDQVNKMIDQVFQNETITGVLDLLGVNKDTLVSFLDPTNDSLIAKILQFFLGFKLKKYGMTPADVFNNLKFNNNEIKENATKKLDNYKGEVQNTSSKSITLTWDDWLLGTNQNITYTSVKANPGASDAATSNTATSITPQVSNVDTGAGKSLAEQISWDIYPELFLSAYKPSPKYPSAFLKHRYLASSENKTTTDLIQDAKKESDQEALMTAFLNWKIDAVLTDKNHALIVWAKKDNALDGAALIQEIFAELEYGQKQQEDMEKVGKNRRRTLIYDKNLKIARLNLGEKEVSSNKIYYIDAKTWAKLPYDHETWLPSDGSPIIFQLVPKWISLKKSKQKKTVTILWDVNYTAPDPEATPTDSQTNASTVKKSSSVDWTQTQTQTQND